MNRNKIVCIKLFLSLFITLSASISAFGNESSEVEEIIIADKAIPATKIVPEHRRGLTPEQYNAIAWTIAVKPTSQPDAIKAALTYATYANDFYQGKNDQVLDTLAVAMARAGDFENAIVTIKRALELSDNEVLSEQYRSRLSLFEANQIYVEVPEGELSSDEVKSLHRLAMEGLPEAQWNLAVYFLGNEIAEYQEVQNPGRFWLMEAAKNGHAAAEEEIAYGYIHGEHGFEKNPVKAKEWIYKGVERGEKNSLYNMAVLLRDNAKSFEDEAEVNDWFLKVSRAGILEGKAELAARIGAGVGSPVNLALQQQYWDELTQAGFSAADYVDGVGPDLLIDDIMRELEITYSEMPGFLFGVCITTGLVKESGLANMIYLPGKDGHTYVVGSDEWVLKTLTIAAHLGFRFAQELMVIFYEESELNNASKKSLEYWSYRLATNQSSDEDNELSQKTLDYLEFVVSSYEETYPDTDFSFILD